MKKLTSLFTAAALMLSASAAVAADKEAREPDVFVNETLVEFADQNAYITDEGRTLVPARGVFEAMDCEVDWDAENYVVTVTNEAQKKEITLTIDNTEMKVVTDGKETVKTLDVPATLMNNRTMVPLRAISESLGCMVVWNEAEYSVGISYTKQITAEEFSQILQNIFNGSGDKGDKEEKPEKQEPVIESDIKSDENTNPETVYTFSSVSARAGEVVEVELACESDTDVKILGVAITEYDDSVLELIGFEFDKEFLKVINNKLSSFYCEKSVITALLEETQAYSGKIGTLTFSVKEDAKAGTYKINAKSSTKTQGMESVLSEIVGGEITIK